MDWEDTADALMELAVALPGYREEEAPLYPLVVVCDDLNATIGLAVQRVVIGTRRRNAKTAAEALKVCAPLAIGGWCVFLERVEQSFRYGIFRPSTLSFAIDPKEILDTADLSSTRVCVVRSLSTDAVELLDDRGRSLQLTISARHPQNTTVPSAIRRIVSHIVADAPENTRDAASRFLVASLTRAVQDCHGVSVYRREAVDRLWRHA